VCVLLQAGRIESTGHQQVVIFPVPSLLASAARSFRSLLGKGVQLGDREITVGQGNFSPVFRRKAFEDTFLLPAKGAGEIRKLHHHYRRLGAALQPRGIVRNLSAGRVQQNHNIRLRSQAVQVGIARELDLVPLQRLAKLILDLRERLAVAIFLRQVISKDFAFAGFSDFTVYFLPIVSSSWRAPAGGIESGGDGLEFMVTLQAPVPEQAARH